MQERAADQDRNERNTRHLGTGVVAGGRAMGKGLWSGVKGLVMQPIKGAKEDGALGFFKGVGRGVIGIVTKPLTGTFDMVSNTFLGVSRTAHIFGPDRRIKRVRNPRHIRHGVLTRFNVREAQGVWLMKCMKQLPEDYLFHAHIHDARAKFTCLCAYTGSKGLEIVFFDLAKKRILLKLDMSSESTRIVVRLAGTDEFILDSTPVGVVSSADDRETFKQLIADQELCSHPKYRKELRLKHIRRDAQLSRVEWLMSEQPVWRSFNQCPSYIVSALEQEQKRIHEKIKTCRIHLIQAVNFTERVERIGLAHNHFYAFEIRVVADFGTWLICRRHRTLKRLMRFLKDSRLKKYLPSRCVYFVCSACA